MKTYNDFLQIGDSFDSRIEFIKSAINEHKGTDLFKEAEIAEEYNKKKNVTIRQFEKYLYTLEGRAIKDYFSANFKLASAFFHRFVTQEIAFLLGNGVSWNDESTKDKLGTDLKPFDTQLKDLAEYAVVGGVAFGFFNYDHMDVFSVTEFVPLYDEEDGSLKAGIRFWQVSSDKPVRATLYEIDGYTDYIWNEKQRDNEEYKPNGRILKDKRPYKLVLKTSEADGTEIYEGTNYEGFPIVPLWANKAKQSELIGIREQIDCYDLIKSGFANTVDEASIVYWLIQNAGGMDDVDMAKFLDRIKTVHAFNADEDGATAEPHTIDYDFSGREQLLIRLANDLYKDAMALDVEQIANGAVTATQIKAAYEPLNSKADELEYRVLEFINGVLAIAGIEGETPSFTRSYIINVSEQIQTLMQASSYLGEEYTVQKILTVLGDGDKTDDVLKSLDVQSANAFMATSAEMQEGDTAKEAVEEQAEQATGKSLTVGQINSLMGIMAQYKEGSLSQSQTVNLVAIALGITKEQAREIILGDEAYS